MSTAPEEHDPFLSAEIERALAPYGALVAPAALEEMRSALRDVLTSHPTAIDLVRRTRPVVAVGQSGERPIDESVRERAPGRARGGKR
jgi:hypothetical protein